MPLEKEVQVPPELMELAKMEFDINNWMDNIVVIKRFKFKDTVQLQRDSVKIQGTATSNPTASVNIADAQILQIVRGVVKAPWGANDVTAVENLPPPVAEWVKDEIEAFNKLEVKKKQN